MPEQVIYQDEKVTLTSQRLETAALNCHLAEIGETRLRGGTAIEEKVFLGIIAFFGGVIALVGVLLHDGGELALGLGLSAITILVILQKCRLVLITGATKRVALIDRDVTYLRHLRNKLEDAREALHAAAAPADQG